MRVQVLSKKGLDMWVQAFQIEEDVYNCRLGLDPASEPLDKAYQFRMDSFHLEALCELFMEMENIAPMHMIKTIMEWGKDVVMDLRR